MTVLAIDPDVPFIEKEQEQGRGFGTEKYTDNFAILAAASSSCFLSPE